MEELILEYLKPELLVLIPVLYFIGLGLKKSKLNDKFIPMTLGGIAIVLAGIYLVATEGWNVNILWIAPVQGVLAAAGSVYTNQIYKQLKKSE